MAVVIVVGLVAICGFLGWRTGVVRRLAELVGLVLSILAAARFASAVTPWLESHTAMSETTALFFSYVLVFVAGLAATWLLAATIQKVVRLTILGWADRLGGAVCGVLLGALLASIGLIAISQGPGGDRVRAAFDDHPAGRAIYDAAPNLYLAASQVFGGKSDELWERTLDAGRQAVDDARDRADELRERAADAAR